MRYILAAVCAVAAGFMTLLYLGGRSAAGEAERDLIWVAAEPITPGTQLAETMLQRVRVDAPTRKLLAGEALPTTPTDRPADWYATRLIDAGQPLLPGRNVSPEPAPTLPDGLTPSDMRVVTLTVDQLPAGEGLIGEKVDIYALPGGAGEAVRLLERAQVIAMAEGQIAVLVPEPQVAPLLTIAEGSAIKVVRHLMEISP